MRTVITVSLNGTAYQLETAAHDQLDEYLRVAARRLAANPDREEILSDLEQAIADKCNRHLGAHKNVVTVGEMTAILKEMGPVEGGADGTASPAGGATASGAEDPPAGSGADAGPADPQAPPGASADAGAACAADPAGRLGPRPFYRIREGRVIAGVCTGVAAYLGWEVAIVRAVVIILSVVSGGMLMLPYLGIALLVPYADTPEQQAAAHGQPFTADDVIRRARAQYEAFRQRSDADSRWARRQFREQRRQWRAQRRFWRHQAHWGVAGPLPPYPRGVLAAVCIPILGLLGGVLTIAFVVALLALLRHHNLPEHLLPGMPWWASLVLLCLLYGMLVSPLHQARHACYYLPPAGAGAALIGTAIWLCLLGAAAWVAWQHWPQVVDLLQQAAHDLRGLLQPTGSIPSSTI